jgi:hypothetical protein
VLVLDKKSALPGFSLARLTELPTEKDRYRPHYGDFSGGFSYTFRAQPEGVHLLVQSTVRPVLHRNLSSLRLILPTEMKSEGPGDNYGVLSTSDSDFLDGENIFGFHGKFFQHFHAWK